ncbi:MAG: hypothetical protein NTX52_04180 [Planctomycetota bacterium]|nr:hypothetical protein [Planctomycetota bacterium]
MQTKVKYGKIAIVIFITVLIWVWADLALDEKLSVSNVPVTVAKSTNPALWVSFGEQPTVSIKNIVLKGPASRITDVKRKLNAGWLILEFFLDAQQEGMVNAGDYNLDVLNFLRKSDQIKQLGLTVESCEPDKLTVKIVELFKKPLSVRCFDESRILLEAESIEPSKVEMFVPEYWGGEKLTAEVGLTRREIEQARVSAIEKTPSIELVAGQRREAATTVKIKMPPAEDALKTYTITRATLGFYLGENLQGRYKVEITNLNEVISPIAIRATPQAKQAYEGMRYQVILEIDDDDVKSEESRKEVIYNFPPEFVRKGEIILNQPPVQARFKLTPLSSTPP